MEIKGKVIQNLGVQNGTSKSGKAWSKAEIVIETDGQYPKKVKLSNLKNAEEFGRISVGSEGVFQIEIESREYQGRWYTDVNCWNWKIPKGYETADTAPSMAVDPLYSNIETKKQETQTQNAEGEDLPF